MGVHPLECPPPLQGLVGASWGQWEVNFQDFLIPLEAPLCYCAVFLPQCLPSFVDPCLLVSRCCPDVITTRLLEESVPAVSLCLLYCPLELPSGLLHLLIPVGLL